MKTRILAFLSLLLAFASAHSGEGVLPEPGPEHGGLRLRLLVSEKEGKDGWSVRLDLLNTTKADITLRADWWHEAEQGDLKEYLEAAASIETWPPFAPWQGQVMAGHRTAPQPEEVVKAGGDLSVTWETDGRKLKNRVANPLSAQNPELWQPGLYSVHVVLVLKTGAGEFSLRSNEQLVRVGGSSAVPKHTYGSVIGVDEEKKTAQLGLGARQKVAAGDQFEVGHPYTGLWKVTITDVWPEYSIGSVEAIAVRKDRATFPERHMPATLVRTQR